MRFKRNPNCKGIALIIVMVAIFVLSILIGGFALSMKVETKLAMNANNEAELIWLGRSGVELARWVVAQQLAIPGEPYDSLNQKWAGGPGTLTSSNSPLATISLDNYQIGRGVVSLKITDMERKFNINQVNEQILQQALTVVGVDAGEIPAISAAILDWTDPDDVTRINGAESDYYQSLNPPYYAKNKPMDDITELLLVRGITPEMFWGPGSTNVNSQGVRVDRWGRPVPEPVYSVGLVELFTTLSSGRINVNTAPAHVLQVIPMVDESGAAQIIQQRSGPDGVDGTEDDVPFRGAGEAGMTINRGAAQQLNQFGAVRSSVFDVIVRANLGGYQRDFHAVIARVSTREVLLLSFDWE